MKKLSNSWIAGFWEGEGSIYKVKNTKGYRVSINQSLQQNRTTQKIMKLLLNSFKGKVYNHKMLKSHYKPQLQWIISKKQDVLYFLKSIYPYCLLRKYDVKIAIDYLSNHPNKIYDINKINYYRKKNYTWLKISKLLNISESVIYKNIKKNFKIYNYDI